MRLLQLTAQAAAPPGRTAAAGAAPTCPANEGEGRDTRMKKTEFAQATDPQSLVENVRRHPPPPHGHHAGAMESVREATYRGHRIVVRTTYHIEVDGVTLEGHLGVTNDGQVHYHPVPNLGFSSAVDLVKQLIDIFPDDFVTQAPGHPHGQET